MASSRSSWRSFRPSSATLKAILFDVDNFLCPKTKSKTTSKRDWGSLLGSQRNSQERIGTHGDAKIPKDILGVSGDSSGIPKGSSGFPRTRRL